MGTRPRMGDKAMYPKSGGVVGAGAADITEPVSRVVREELRVLEDELRAELRQQSRRRTVKLHGAAAAAALYGGAALAVAVGLLLALVMPAWAAFLLVAVALFAAAMALRNAARTRPPRTAAESDPQGPHHRA